MKRNICYCEYYGSRHLELITLGWREYHCLYVDGMVLIKMVMEMIVTMETIFDSFVNQLITDSEAVDLLKKFCDMTQQQAIDIVLAWNSSEDLPAYSQASWYS